MAGNKEGRYERIYSQLEGLLEESGSQLSKMSTITAVLHHKMEGFFWTGFYILQENRLLVGPYQGPVACQILRGEGVCLHVLRTRAAVVVPDVDAFPGHIACDARSKSEIALPVLKDDRAVAVFDVDSDRLDQFTEADIEPLRRILSLLDPYL